MTAKTIEEEINEVFGDKKKEPEPSEFESEEE